MLNSFLGIGRLGSDPEMIKKNGGMVACFDLAINEFFKQDNELQKKTHWIPCVAFGRMAEISGEFLKKGSQVGVRGTLQSDEWRDDAGNKKKQLRVHVGELEFLSSRVDSETENKTE